MLRIIRPISVRGMLGFLGMVVLAMWCVKEYTLVHPYMLADNRHYTFYIWKDILGRSDGLRLLLSPVYAICLMQLVSGTAAQQGWIWTCGFALCLATAVTPAWLIEFRYFTVGTIFYALHIQPPTNLGLWLNLALFAFINSVTLWMFASRHFLWPDGTVARFMW